MIAWCGLHDASYTCYRVAMLGKLYSDQDCSAARTLELVGERWSLLILRDALSRGYRRFSEFERSLGIAPNILSKRLEGFVDAGIMTVEYAAGRKDAREYVLTERGLALKPILMALTEWGDAWVRPGPIEFVDADGARLQLLAARASDGRAVDLAEVGIRRLR